MSLLSLAFSSGKVNMILSGISSPATYVTFDLGLHDCHLLRHRMPCHNCCQSGLYDEAAFELIICKLASVHLAPTM